jgi:hypothetical protein
VANYLWLLNDGSSRILLNNGTDKLALNEEVVADTYGWQPPLSEPSRHIRRAVAVVAALAGAVGPAFTPTAGDADVAFASTSNQVINKTVIYEDRTSYAETPVAAETITADKWYTPLSTPVRRRVLTDPQEYAQAPHTPFAIAWAKALDLPVRRKFTWYGEYGYGNFLPHTNDTRWYSQLTTPTRRKHTLGQVEFAQAAYTPPAAEVVTADKWFAELDTPVRRRVSLSTDYGFVYLPEAVYAPGNANLAFTTTSSQVINRTIVYESEAYAPYTPPAELITVDKWWRQLEVPVRRRQLTAVEGSLFRPSFPQVPWGWYEKLDEPFRLKKTPSNQISLTFVAAAPGNGVAQNWFFPLEIPTRARKLNEYPATAIPVYFVPPTPGAGLELNWWPQLNEPVRPKRYLAQQQAIAVPSRLLTTTLEHAWYQPLTTPTRLKLSFGQYPAVVQGNITPVVPTAWYQLHSPLRIKHRFNYEAAAPHPYQEPFVELVTIDKWWQELARPIYTKRIDRPALTQSNVFPVVPIAWQQLHTPLRLKGRINYPAMAQGNINPVVPYAWHQLHTPHRLKGRIDYPAHFRALYPVNFPGTGVGTNQPWPALSEPVRYSPRLRPGQQQFLSYYPLLLSSDLDPACRILTPDAMYVTLAGDADTAVVPEAQTTVVANEDEDTVTPENQDNIIVVKC